ncbi:MAG TPA: hypothetical protein VII06_13285 [Chloroflexota bacterium]|jgi:hypothetical protein
MIHGDERKPLNPPSFKVSDWREIFDLYPKQWLAIAVDEITPGVGITAGHVIARGKKDRTVLDKLKQFLAQHPQQEFAFFYTGRILPSGLDMV